MKKIMTAIAATIIASTCIFFACSKEENETTNYSDSFLEKKIIVGTLSVDKNGEQNINPTFDKDDYLQKLERILSENKSNNAEYIAEDAETYINKDGLPILRVAIFDIANDLSNNVSFKLEKVSFDKAATIGYAIAGTGHGGNLSHVCQSSVTCTGTNCDFRDHGELIEVGCRLKTANIGGEEIMYCSQCFNGGTCTRNETSTNIAKSICMAF